MISVKLNISDKAVNWYKDELKTANTKYVRFFPRYGGVGGIIAGFSIGINFDRPENILASYENDGMIFFIEQSDAWYFEGKSKLNIEFDEKLGEPQFIYS